MADNKAYISVLQVTDPHIMAMPDATLLGINTALYFNAVLQHAFQSRQFDVCLLTGDVAQQPCLDSYQYVLDSLQAYNVPCLCLPGNHDDFAIMQAALHTANINCNKLKIIGNWQIISLNSQVLGSQVGYLANAELRFLEDCLQQQPELNTLIALHHHCLPTESVWMDTMIIGNAEDFFAAIKPYPGIKAIVNGHIHQAMELTYNAVRVLTTPSTCFQFKPYSERFSLDDLSPGYRWLQLYEDGSLQSGVERLPQLLTGLQTETQGY